ncbi:hypothetical protein SAMN05421856_109117 [Chryseobacterium taichungense]|uniref:Uncharacterized protein n=1 Tax=Chryseobacterium taichungense TaxID=295069 RepID=A0A1H8CJL9_9FLAO|nr:hypothetical protein [Chryseobacterium taichungense]SEM95109.1 hypothetical protein SAMN05421856_109117 [Chryseobacterium taichungense]
MKKIVLTIAIFGCTLFFAQKSENYLQIGYASVCCGTPSDKPVMDYLTKFKQKNKVKNLEIYKQSGLGREGEYNLYIGTDGLSKTQKNNFIKGLKAAVSSQNNARSKNSDGMVNFNESEIIKKADLSNARNLTQIK